MDAEGNLHSTSLQSDTKILQVVILQAGALVRRPSIEVLVFGQRLVAIGRFVRKPLPARIDRIHDEPRALADAILVINRDGIVDASAGDAQHRPAAMKTEVDRHANILAGIRKGSVNRLAAGDRNVAGRADHRHRIRQALRTGRRDHRLDVLLGAAMRSRDDPQSVGGVASIELRHEVEPVSSLVQLGTLPVRPAILMPRDRAAEPGLLYPYRLVERSEVGTVDRFGDFQQLRMAIETQACIGELQRTEYELDDPLGRTFGRSRLGHLHRMTSVGIRGAADRIGERFYPTHGWGLAIGPERRSSLAIDDRTFRDRRVRDDVGHVALDVLEFVVLQQSLEDIEPAALVSIEDRAIEVALGIEADRAAIAEPHRAFLALATIALHRSLIGPIIDDGYLDERQTCHLNLSYGSEAGRRMQRAKTQRAFRDA